MKHAWDEPVLRVGLVGFGYASQTFHAPLISAVPSLALVAVCSSDAAKVHADWPGVTVHATPAELIMRDDIDLVVIATPNDTHHPLAREALLAGRHVVVDKPFTQEPYGIGLKKDDTEFRGFINDTLDASFTDGTWAAAWEATAGTVLGTPTPPAVDRY